MIQQVSDLGSNPDENIAHAAKIIEKSRHRRAIFNAVYNGKQRIKSVSKLVEVTPLSRKQVLIAGKALADNTLIKQVKIHNETGYEKIDFFHQHKEKILSLAKSPKKLKKFPTKRNPSNKIYNIRLQIKANQAKIKQVTIDDIDSFRRVRRVSSKLELGDKLSEKEFKNGIKTIIGEKGQFKDWGGEKSDLYSTKVKIKNKRISTAIAFKGPATTGKLTPGKMGKNGDQIQRLFEEPANLFLVQYCYQVNQSVISLMERLSLTKAVMTGQFIRFGVIDGNDSYRLVIGYPNAFKNKSRNAK